MSDLDVTPCCLINPNNGEVTFNNKVLTLRPKTFELLQLIASRSSEVISKEEILSTIWAGSVVEEQVVFQSINEIRRLLNQADCIKTYPKRGYSWTVENTQWVNLCDTSVHEVESMVSSTYSYRKFGKLYWLMGLLLITLCCTFMLVNQVLINQDATEPEHEAILVLPFSTKHLEGIPQWERYAGMRQVIGGISPSDNSTVFRLEDSLEILNRLPLEDRENSEQLFAKSGASIILHTDISGVPGEYNIVLSFLTPSTKTRQVFSAHDLNSIVSQTLQRLSEVSTNSVNVGPIQSSKSLQNELLTQAIHFINNGDHEAAKHFLQTAVINDDTDLLTLYYLIQVTFQQGDLDALELLLERVGRFEEDPNYAYYAHRITYIRGAYYALRGQFLKAKRLLRDAGDTAKANKDWLYFAHSNSMLGKLFEANGQFQTAQDLFQEAIHYHQLIQCPMGLSTGYLDLSKLFAKANQPQKAIQHFQIAKEIVRRQKLTQLYDDIDDFSLILVR